MPLIKLQFRPGINKEQTNYANEGTWVDCDKVRFHKGFPEKIGGWQRVSTFSFLGICRSLWQWATLGGSVLLGVGTHLKMYIDRGGQYFDITPIRETTAAGAVTFAATNGSNVITVTDTNHGAIVNDFVTFSGAVSLGGNITAAILNAEHQITEFVDANTYRITVSATANASDTGNGGASVVGAYQVNTGSSYAQSTEGWGSGGWGLGTWGNAAAGVTPIRIWNQVNYGEDLIFGIRGGGLYYWDASVGVGTRGVAVVGSDVPVVHNQLLVSDVSRFVIVFGCNELGQTNMDPMLVRWSDQEDYTNWTPAVTNQAGGLRLSNGSKIVSAKQNRQEILIWTDAALYSMQFQGAPFVWGFQLIGENISCAGPGATAVSSNTAFWMGTDRFYVYDGRTRPLISDVRDYVFDSFDATRGDEVVCGTNEAFNEIWWFYPVRGQALVRNYVIYNYLEQTWYIGTLTRTAWIDSALQGRPLAANGNNIVEHEVGTDDASAASPQPIVAYLQSADVEIADGDQATFVWRVLPDITFKGSTAMNPSVQLSLTPRAAPGSGYKSPRSVGGESQRTITRTATVPVEQFTEQVNIRVRGRQVSMRIDSQDIGVAWRLGLPRADARPDGRRG